MKVSGMTGEASDGPSTSERAAAAEPRGSGALKYVLPILFRYASLVLQFLVVVLVTRRLPQVEAGMYFLVFGVINATYFLFGVGLPDGLVRFVAHADATERQAEIRSMISRSSVVAVALAVVTIFAGAISAMLFGKEGISEHVIVGTAAWWFSYGLTFFASQILVAAGRSSLGAFFYYPAMNISLFVTSVPYLVIADKPRLELTLLAAALGGVLCAGSATGAAIVATRTYPRSTVRAPIKPAFHLGLSIGISRVLQSCIYWLPVWAVGLWQGASAAAVFGTASRLNVAVAAVMAAIRFTIRPTIVRLSAHGDWEGIGREGRRTANAATIMAIFAILGAATVGPPFIATVFGENYRNAAWILVLLLFGTLGECLGGAVDEILKMTGRASLVLTILAVTVAVEAALLWAANAFGAGGSVSAATQALVLVTMYVLMLSIVNQHDKVWVGASPFLRRDPPSVGR